MTRRFNFSVGQRSQDATAGLMDMGAVIKLTVAEIGQKIGKGILKLLSRNLLKKILIK